MVKINIRLLKINKEQTWSYRSYTNNIFHSCRPKELLNKTHTTNIQRSCTWTLILSLMIQIPLCFYQGLFTQANKGGRSRLKIQKWYLNYVKWLKKYQNKIRMILINQLRLNNSHQDLSIQNLIKFTSYQFSWTLQEG